MSEPLNNEPGYKSMAFIQYDPRDGLPEGDATMTKDNDGGPAFPRHYGTSFSAERETSNWHGGMSLRDWFAGQALAVFSHADIMKAIHREADAQGIEPPILVARSAYELADAMLKERQK